MAEFVEREALRSKAVYMHGFGSNKYVPLRAIEDAPAADVAPVVHGRWEFDRPGTADGMFSIVRCSGCGHEAFAAAIYVKDGHYCPFCGARMDGE